MSILLDPWADAREIAVRLRQPDARLIVILGAEAWCEKCRQLRSIVEARATQAATNETWLWLDLEEHAEFLGDYLPDDLPLLLRYDSGKITRLQVVKPNVNDLEMALQPHPQHERLKDPGIYLQLIRDDWAA